MILNDNTNLPKQKIFFRLKTIITTILINCLIIIISFVFLYLYIDFTFKYLLNFIWSINQDIGWLGTALIVSALYFLCTLIYQIVLYFKTKYWYMAFFLGICNFIISLFICTGIYMMQGV